MSKSEFEYYSKCIFWTFIKKPYKKKDDFGRHLAFLYFIFSFVQWKHLLSYFFYFSKILKNLF